MTWIWIQPDRHTCFYQCSDSKQQCGCSVTFASSAPFHPSIPSIATYMHTYIHTYTRTWHAYNIQYSQQPARRDDASHQQHTTPHSQIHNKRKSWTNNNSGWRLANFTRLFRINNQLKVLSHCLVCPIGWLNWRPNWDNNSDQSARGQQHSSILACTINTFFKSMTACTTLSTTFLRFWFLVFSLSPFFLEASRFIFCNAPMHLPHTAFLLFLHTFLAASTTL